MKEEQSNEKDIRHRKQKANVKCKSSYINNNIEWEWLKQFNQKADIFRLA